VAIFRKIDLRRPTICIEHRADLLHEIESDIAHLLFAEPAGDRSALQCDRQRAQLFR
jgi:hypothetical protein